MFTVEDIMEITGQKRGTIDQFRNELQSFGLTEKNKSLDDRAVATFKKAIAYKEENNVTWTYAMHYVIQKEYDEEMELPFLWKNDIILKELIWKINNNLIEVKRVHDQKGLDYYAVYHLIIDNFEKLGRIKDFYINSSGTDGNPIPTFICQGKDYIYYLVGKHNSITKNEDIHVFYNEGTEFSTMRCKHICGGSGDKGRLKELWEICLTLAPNKFE